MAGFNRDTVYADNVDFTGSVQPTPQVTADGQLLIGSAVAPKIRVATLTAGTGVSITNAAGSITIALAGSGVAVEHLTGNTGGVLNPDGGNNFTLLGTTAAAGTTPVTIAGVGSILTTKVQISQALAATDATKIGLSNFNSANFSVDANGFVSIIGGGFGWTDVTSATQVMAIENGYITDRGAGVVYTLPATAALGAEIIVVGKLGLTTITPNANQQILMGSTSGTVGATGTAVGTNVGDSITLIATTSGSSTVWRAASWVGSWTLT